MDKLEKFVESGGSLIYKGEKLEKLDETTFAQKKILEGDKFGLL